jgi:hypothetical protein
MKGQFLLILAICITVAASWIFLLADRKPVRASAVNPGNERQAISRLALSERSRADLSAEAAGSRSPSPLTLRDPLETNPFSNTRIAPERLNAALAAGLIDPSGIAFLNPIVPPVSAATERSISLIGPGVSVQNPIRDMESGAPLATAVIPTRMVSAITNPTKPFIAVSSSALSMEQIPYAQAKPIAQVPPTGTIPAPVSEPIHWKGPIARNTPSVRLVARPEFNSPEVSSTQQIRGQHGSARNGTKTSAKEKTADLDPQAKDVGANIQRFVSDFVRVNQTDDIAGQHRFFAQSVNFYHEGDLSLAGVEAATKRHHHAEQLKRSEVAGPAVATGPVNGGFFVIKQPVRWTQSQGSKITQGRSVLQLRVVPIDHGGWKITSIDEVNR